MEIALNLEIQRTRMGYDVYFLSVKKAYVLIESSHLQSASREWRCFVGLFSFLRWNTFSDECIFLAVYGFASSENGIFHPHFQQVSAC